MSEELSDWLSASAELDSRDQSRRESEPNCADPRGGCLDHRCPHCGSPSMMRRVHVPDYQEQRAEEFRRRREEIGEERYRAAMAKLKRKE